MKKRIIMMTKKQSKKMNQLKYLVLIPVLASMLFYTSCSETEMIEDITVTKELQTRYFEVKEGVKVSKGEKETYLDYYFGFGTPEGEEVSYNDLTVLEREEYDEIFDKFKSREDNKFTKMITLKVYKKKNGRKTLAALVDMSLMSLDLPKAKQLSDGSFSVLQIGKTPIYPGCKERDLDCFFNKLEKHFQNTFDKSIVNNLGLSSGKKKAYVSFNINVNGKVVDIKVRAPHKVIKEEVIKVINSLPKMTAGEKEGKPVKVKFTLPFVFEVE